MATWVKIKVDLERRLAKSSDPLCKEVLGLVLAAREAEKELKERDRGGEEATWGWMYMEFRKSLGNDLAVPPSPSSAWISTQVSRCRRLGLNEQQISDICGAVRLPVPVEAGRLWTRRGPFDLEWLLRRAPQLLAEWDRASPEEQRRVLQVQFEGIERGDSGSTGGNGGQSAVVTGRPDVE